MDLIWCEELDTLFEKESQRNADLMEFLIRRSRRNRINLPKRKNSANIGKKSISTNGAVQKDKTSKPKPKKV